MLEIVSIDTPSLGDRSYFVTDGKVALVIDPQRDIDRVLALAEKRGVRITDVFETHIHNDYVTGGYHLAKSAGARYHVNADDPVSYDRNPVRDGDVIEVGDAMRVRVIHTPGHTFTHLSYALENDGEAVGVFTGGSLIYGSTGRPDLLGPEHTETLARKQYRSAQRLARELPDSTAVYPTHGFGSFCSATQAEGLSSTIGHEAKINPALTQNEADFIADLLAGLDAFPAYYAHMGPANLGVPAPADLTPPAQADPAELRRRIEAGEWVVDLRSGTAFAAGHVPGTYNFGTADGSFITYLGWLIPWGTPVTLLGETAAQVEAAQRDLLRIGIDRPAAAATGTPEEWVGDGSLASYPVVTFADLAAAMSGNGPANGSGRPVVLDVRRNDERQSFIAGSLHIPIHETLLRIDEVPSDAPVWVHCGGGYRALIVGSILAQTGRRVVVINDQFDAAARVGLPIEPAAESRQPVGAARK